MLPKKNRVDTKGVKRVFLAGKFINSPLVSFKYVLENNRLPSRISVVAPKTVAKRAVDRNSLRRRGYQALKKYLNKFPIGLVGVLVFKKPPGSVSEVEKEIENILTKIN